MKNPDIKPMVVGTTKACFLLGCGKTKLFALLKTGQIQAVRFGGRTMIPTAELERFASMLPRRGPPKAASTGKNEDGANTKARSGERA